MMRLYFCSLILTFCVFGAQAEETETRLKPGTYEIKMTLELPHLANAGVAKTVVSCLSANSNAGYGLIALSSNNPLAACPLHNIRQQNGTLTFDIICEGANAPHARAKYEIQEERFRGRIVMNMGGKNMTLTETQKGRRMGSCDEASHSQGTVD